LRPCAAGVSFTLTRARIADPVMMRPGTNPQKETKNMAKKAPKKKVAKKKKK
jgi:hypothetical protein